jgi:hypothetical protein
MGFEKELEMKLAMVVASAVTTLTCISLPAQQTEETTPAGDPAKVTYASTAGGFGDLAFAHAYEMSAVTCELDGKLDSKTAKVGDRVVLKTDKKVQTSDGTVIPRGTRLVGHVTEAQPYDGLHGPARIAIAFDHAELKNGQTIAVHTLIRSVNLSANAMTVPQTYDEGGMGMPVPIGTMASSARLGGPGTGSTAPGYATSQVDRVSDAAVAEGNREDANQGSTPGSTGSTATQRSGGLSSNTGAHGVAAARAIPHPTGIPGVMLAGNSTSSGVLLASRQNIRLDSEAQIELGVVGDR